MVNIKLLQKQILSGYGLDVGLKINNNRDRKNIYKGYCADNNESYFIKFEEAAKGPRISEISKVLKILNNSKRVIASEYIISKSGDFYIKPDGQDYIVTLCKWLDIKPFRPDTKDDCLKIIAGVAEFHTLLQRKRLPGLVKSDFFHDFMQGDVFKSQDKNRMRDIKDFFKKHTPDYSKLTMGAIHNDLHLDNIGTVNKKFFITDFEHMKHGPLISDIGVIILDLWDEDGGYADYQKKLKEFLKRYARIIELSDYDVENVINFSMRYLQSDYNWFTYWNRIRGGHSKDLNKAIKRMRLFSQYYEA